MTKKHQDVSSFEAVLRDVRRELRFGMRALASVSGVHEATIGRWERGRTSPSLDDRLKVVTAIARSGAPPAVVERLRVAGGLGPLVGVTGTAVAHVDDATTKLAVDSALLAMADALDMSPRALGPAAAAMLARLAEAGVDVKRAAATLAARTRAP